MNRNDECWCQSGKKYKKCHMEFDERLNELKRKGFIVPDRDIIKTPSQIEGIKASANINTKVLDEVSKHIKAGMSTEEIDTIVYKTTTDMGAVPAPLNYQGYPKSVCTSINDEVCHGIPDPNIILKDGDIINVDVSTIYNGYYSDASRMFIIGEAEEHAIHLVNTAKEALLKGIEAAKPWGFLGDISYAVQSYAESKGYSVVRDFGGHGIGLKFHEEPFVPHFGSPGEDMVLVPGMIFTVEPMINEGTYEIVIDEDDEWTVFTEDGGLSAQWEYMVLITETGVEILTK